MNTEVLVATMNQSDLSLAEKMNIEGDVFLANQCGICDYKEQGRIRMLSTDTVGVGVNRNLALSFAKGDILLFADDDMVYYDGAVSEVLKAFEQNPRADVMIFCIDYTRNGEVFDKRRHSFKKLRLFNALKYGACRTAVRKDAIKKYNITFSTLFGGGCIYGSGEDSLFLCDCFRAGLEVYAHPLVLGACSKDDSTWFEGFNPKFMFDKGAFIAAAFPKTKHIMKLYFAFKFSKKSELTFSQTISYMNKGIKAFKTLTPFEK